MSPLQREIGKLFGSWRERFGTTLLISSILLPSIANASGLSEIDLGLKLGGSVTTVEYLEKITKNQLTAYERASVSVSGMPLAVFLTFDLNESISVLAEAGATVMIRSRRMLRKGFEGGLAWHLLGGSRKTETRSGFMIESARNSFNLSWSCLGAAYSYGLSDTSSTGDNGTIAGQAGDVSGSTFELSTGLQIRRDLSERSSVGIDVQRSIYSIPTSKEEIIPTTTSASMFWRFLI